MHGAVRRRPPLQARKSCVKTAGVNQPPKAVGVDSPDDELPPLEGEPAWKKWATRIVTLAVVGAIGFGIWWRFVRDRPPPKKELVTAKLDRGTIQQTVSATGTIYPVNQVEVGTQVSGTVAEIRTDRNKTVTAGDIIAVIDPSRYEAQLSQTRAAASVAEADVERVRVQIREAEQTLARVKSLVDRGAGAQAELDAAEIALARAKADLRGSQARANQAYAAVKSARVDLDKTVIRAPISGVVIKRSVDVGQTVAAAMQAPVLFQIAADLSEMEVRAAVDQADIGKLSKGQTATFTIAGEKEPFEATVHDIWLSPTVTQSVVTYDVILRVQNRGGKLLPQMTANVKVTTAKKEGALRVPNAALRFKPPKELIAEEAGTNGRQATGDRRQATGDGGVRRGPEGEVATKDAKPDAVAKASGRGGGDKGGMKIWVKTADGKLLRAVPVVTGIADDSFTEIVSGALKEGDEIVTEMRTGKKGAGSQPMGGQRGGGRGGLRM